MICDPCAKAAAADRSGGGIRIGHLPETCRDFAVQPAGCACAHKPAGSATEHLAVITSGQEN